METQAFNLFADLTPVLKQHIIAQLDNPKDYLNAVVSVVDAECLPYINIQSSINGFNKKSFMTLITMIKDFQHASTNLRQEFTSNTPLKTRHFDLFMAGYPNSSILNTTQYFNEYNHTMRRMVSNVARNMVDDEFEYYHTLNDITGLHLHTFNSIRLKPHVQESAMNTLFVVDDDVVHHDKIIIEFESNVVFIIEFNTCTMHEDGKQWIEVSATCYNRYNNREIQFVSDISYRDDETLEWIENNPFDWLDTFITSAKTMLGDKLVLGLVKDITYRSNTEQFWRKAYFEMDVLPQLLTLTC
jgi:hypothetical protein